jgi:hypothetical protein
LTIAGSFATKIYEEARMTTTAGAPLGTHSAPAKAHYGHGPQPADVFVAFGITGGAQR